jgi:hypothetical protein
MGEAKDRKNAAEERAVRQVDKVIQLVYLTATAGAGVAELAPEDVPRLCVAAGVRVVERLLEQYHGIMAADGETRQEMALLPADQADEANRRYLAMLTARRRQIVQGLEDLHVALAEGQQNVAALGASLIPPKVVVQ